MFLSLLYLYRFVLLFACVMLGLLSSVVSQKIGKNVSKMTYFVSTGT